MDEYIQISKEKYGYNAEQALGMLFWHKHDLDRAIQDLANFTPFPDEWTVEDKVLFEQAFQFHGKSFHRIRQMLPDKSIAQLVKYYYGWKKTRTRTSLMDRQARKLQVQREQGAVPTGEFNLKVPPYQIQVFVFVDNFLTTRCKFFVQNSAWKTLFLINRVRQNLLN